MELLAADNLTPWLTFAGVVATVIVGPAILLVLGSRVKAAEERVKNTEPGKQAQRVDRLEQSWEQRWNEREDEWGQLFESIDADLEACKAREATNLEALAWQGEQIAKLSEKLGVLPTRPKPPLPNPTGPGRPKRTRKRR